MIKFTFRSTKKEAGHLGIANNTRSTYVEIIETTETSEACLNLIIAEGFSQQHFRDKDCKVIGQKIAVANALQEERYAEEVLKTRPNRIKRTEIWNAFFDYSNATRRLVKMDTTKVDKTKP